MRIGIPIETDYFEKRVSLAPHAVRVLRKRGNEIFITSDAGKNSGYTNDDYIRCGAYITKNNKETYEKTDIIVKIMVPNDIEENYLNDNHILFCFLNLLSNKEKAISLSQRGITAIGYETISDINNEYPILSSMSRIAGKLSFSIASEILAKPVSGKGLLLGGSPSASRSKVVVIGGGNAGMEMIKLSLNAGSRVSVFDSDIQKLNKISYDYPSVETFYPYHDLIIKQLKNADVVLGATFANKKNVTKMVSDQMIKMMEQSSVIIDLTTENGGIFETSRITTLDDPIYNKHGIFHYCVPNIAACVPKTASNALSTSILPFLLQITEGLWVNSDQMQGALQINEGTIEPFILTDNSKKIKKAIQQFDKKGNFEDKEIDQEKSWRNIEEENNKKDDVSTLEDFEDLPDDEFKEL